MIRNLLKNETGYSLVEILAAIMILAIAIIPMVGMFDMGLKAASLGGNYDRARAIAREELDEIRTLPYSSPDPEPASGTANSVVEIFPPVNGNPAGSPKPCTPPIDAGFGCEVETTYVSVGDSAVTANSGARTMMEVEVTVTWNGGGNSYTMTGLISKETR